MKKPLFITMFIVSHIGFFILHIRQQIEGVKASFQKQKNEKSFAELEQKKQSLKNELQILQNKQKIKEFAQTNLALKPMKLTQIHRLHHEK